MKQSDLEKIDIIALDVMKCIIQGIYANPNSLAMLGTIASENNQSLNQEIVERSYTLAHTMLKSKLKYINDEG